MYANTGITHLSKLMTLNNKLLRILQNKTYSTPLKELYADYNTLPVPQLHKLQLLLLVHKYYYHKYLLPKIYYDYFQPNQGMYSYETRNKADLFHTVTTTFGQSCIKFKGALLWNNLTNHIKSICSIRSLNLRQNCTCNKIVYWNN